MTDFTERRDAINAQAAQLAADEAEAAAEAQRATLDQIARNAAKTAELEAIAAEARAVAAAEEDALLQARADRKFDEILEQRSLEAQADIAKANLEGVMGNDKIWSITFTDFVNAIVLWHREPDPEIRRQAESILRVNVTHGL